MTHGQWQRSLCCHTKPTRARAQNRLAPNRFKGVIGVNEFQMHLRWLAEQRRLADLERRYRQAERVALRELLLASSDDDAETDEDLEVIEDGENEATD
jgi:hypothetical protein